MEEKVRKKAELILGGNVLVPKGFRPPFRLSRSTAGPGAGAGSVAFEFDGMRVKKSISQESGDFELRDNDGKMSITRKGEPFIDDVRMIPIIFHSPNHAFFNLSQRCIFRCAFCTTPLLGNDAVKDLSSEKIVAMIRDFEKTAPIPSVALTSGVDGSVRSSVERMASCVRILRKEFPDKIIGVEPYTDTEEQIDLLRAAGADEFKLNREAARKDIFEKVCPGLNYDNVFEMLRYAVSVFGKGRVCSNVIYGLGEADSDVTEEMERLASIGCIPGLRALRTNAMTAATLRNILGDVAAVDAERAVRLAEEQRRIMTSHGLTTGTFRTMCFECQCCDIVPFVDV
jgi:biotin synthase-related radical SAM superfamily protein